MAMESPATDAVAKREKQLVAMSSLLAAVGLTLTKLTVGWMTNSLGILSEAMHSGLDLVAAAITLWAVHAAGKPADSDHTYGHGKFENLSALLETLLLLITCVWIVYEAGRRMLGGHVDVEANIWAFLVVILSIVVDISRSRALHRAAVKYHSQALEADALHFSTDIWSSLVVLAGLTCVWLGERLNLPWLARADALAALGVAMIVIWVSLRLGRRALDDLLDRIPRELQQEVATAAANVPGVEEVRQVRIRRSGPEVFMDMTVAVDQSRGLGGAQDVATQTESAVRSVVPRADVVVRVEPTHTADLLSKIRNVAERQGVRIHNVRIFDAEGWLELDLHMELDQGMRIDDAHRQATSLEQAIRHDIPDLRRIYTHIEPYNPPHAVIETQPEAQSRVVQALQEFFAVHPQLLDPHRLAVRTIGGELTVSFDCRLQADTTVSEAHGVTQQLETFLRGRVPEVQRMVIHVEPVK